MNERRAGVGSGAGVLHAAGYKIIHHGLRIFFPRIVHAKLPAEEIDHRRSTAVIEGKAVATPLRRVVSDGDTVPTVFHFFEFTSDNGDQIGGARDGFLPRPGFETFAGVRHADELAVGDGDPRRRDGENRLGREPIVRVIVSRHVVARVFGLALRPNLAGAVRVILVRQDEIETLGRLSFVAYGDVEFVASLGGGA